MNLVKMILSASFVLLVNPVFAGTFFVGNGGTGFLIGQDVYVSDLFWGSQNEMYRHPWFGQGISQSFQSSRLASLSRTIGISHELLGRKLTDLDQLDPGLGFFVAEALLSYRWILLNEDFKLGPTCDQAIAIPSELNAFQVQIANRFQDEIRIQSSIWERMNPEQRIALVIHEGIYSLLSPHLQDGCNFGKAHSVRRIVSEVFTDVTARGASLPADLLSGLSLSPIVKKCQRLFGDFAGAFGIRMRSKNLLFPIGLSKEQFDYSRELIGHWDFGDKLRNPIEIVNLCQGLKGSGFQGSELEIRAVRQPVQAQFGRGQIQFVPVSAKGRWVLPWDPSGCERLLSRVLDGWYVSDIQNGPGSACSTEYDLARDTWNWKLWDFRIRRN